jgi:hypothetical protein
MQENCCEIQTFLCFFVQTIVFMSLEPSHVGLSTPNEYNIDINKYLNPQ